MNDLEELERRLRLSMLKAQLALREMERTALTIEIDSPLTTPERKAQAIARRDAVHSSAGGIACARCPGDRACADRCSGSEPHAAAVGGVERGERRSAERAVDAPPSSGRFPCV